MKVPNITFKKGGSTMKKILIAYDGSTSSRKSIKTVEAMMVLNSDIQVCLFSISNTSNPYTNAMMQRNIRDEAVEKIQKAHVEIEKEEHVNEIKNQLSRIRLELETQGVQVETKVVVIKGNHNPGEDICEYAEKNEFDLIVVGSRGLGNVKKLILGSVSNYVVNHAEIPVLVVK